MHGRSWDTPFIVKHWTCSLPSDFKRLSSLNGLVGLFIINYVSFYSSLYPIAGRASVACSECGMEGHVAALN